MGNKNSGARPRPTGLKLLQGNPGKRRLNAGEPTPPPGPVEMPPGLSPGARRVWGTLAPVCLHMRTLTMADATDFARLCELEALWVTVIRTRGTPRFKMSEALALARELRAYFAQFGLEPSSRARLQVPPIKPVSKWADAV